MSSDLVGEIQREALVAQPDLPSLLRKCIALGGQSGSASLREWATYELKGYDSGTELPGYRIIPASLVLDGSTMTHRVTGQAISPASLPDIARDKIKEEVRLHGPVAELVDAIKSARTNGDDFINFGIPGSAALTALTNHHFRTKGIEYQSIERIYLRTSVTSLVGVIDTVQTNLVELMAELSAGMTSGDSLPSSALAEKAVNIVIHGDRNRVSVDQAISEAQGSATITTRGPKESKLRTIMFWVGGAATVSAAVIALLVWHPW
jgi:hypothetical protein